MEFEIKKLLIEYLIGYFTKEEIIQDIDNIIVSNEWIDEFDYLSTPSQWENEDLLDMLKYGKLEVLASDFTSIRCEIFNNLLNRILCNKINWFEILSQTVLFLKLEMSIFNQTSNDTPIVYFELIDDFELREDGYAGILKMPESLTNFLSEYGSIKQ